MKPTYDLGQPVRVRLNGSRGWRDGVVCGVFPHYGRTVDVRLDDGTVLVAVPVSRLARTVAA